MPELLLKAPDPEAFGKIRAIVRTAHKWGGNGREAKFRKIKRVLSTKHPEVIAKAFGGNANVAAAWIKDNWAAMHGVMYPGADGKFGPTFWRRGKKAKKGTLPASLDSWYEDIELDGSVFDSETTELFLSTTEIEERDGLVWKPVCRTGKWKVNPTGGTGPLELTEDVFKQAITNFKRKAWEFVTLPLSHRDQPHENTGYVQDLEIRDDPKRPGVKRLWAGMNITEPDIKGKVLRGTIPSQSVGMALNGVTNQETGERIKGAVLKHVCWTPKPFVSGLNYGDLFASQDSQAMFMSYELDDEEEDFDLADLGLLELESGSVAWDDTKTWGRIEEQIRQRLGDFSRDWRTTDMPDEIDSELDADYDSEQPVSPGDASPPKLWLWLRGIMENKALVCAQVHGVNDTYWVAEYDVADSGEVTLDPPDEWQRVEQQWIALAQDMVFFDYEPPDVAEIDSAASESQNQETPVLKRIGAFLKLKRSPKTVKVSTGDAFPIPDVDHLKKAIQAFGRAKPEDRAKVKAHIISRAKALGREDLIPEDWLPNKKKDAKLVRLSLSHDTSKGGAQMEDEETIELTTEELDRRIEEAATRIADERVGVLLAERDERIESTEVQLTRERKTNHKLRVDRRVEELNKAGFPPAIVKTAKALYLTDETGEETGHTLNLTREVGEGDSKEVKTEEINLTITKVVDLMLEAYPAASLAETSVELDLSETSQPPAAGDETTDEAADEEADSWYDQKVKEGRIIAGTAAE